MTSQDNLDPSELAAYVDDQLDAGRRIAVESALSRDPAAAAEVMADLRLRDELRLALASRDTVRSPRTNDLARRLQNKIDRHAWLRRLRPLAAASVLITAGWIAHGQLGGVAGVQASGTVPDYVSAAIQAHRASAVRARMVSQPESPVYDAAELLAETAITMPELPTGWRVSDVQVYPSPFGPSVEMVVHSDDFGTASLYAARPGQFVVMLPTINQTDGATTAYWQVGEIAYALVAAGEPRPVSAAAQTLFESLF